PGSVALTGRGLSLQGLGSAFLRRAKRYRDRPTRGHTDCSGQLLRNRDLSPPPRHLASGDVSVTIRPLILILAQRVSSNMARRIRHYPPVNFDSRFTAAV